MAQRRLINRSLGSSQKLYRIVNEYPEAAELTLGLFQQLVVHADDHGRLPGDAFTVLHQVIPVFAGSGESMERIELSLIAMNNVGLIKLYEVAGKRYLLIENFREEQPGIKYIAKAIYPEPVCFLGFTGLPPIFHKKRCRREVEEKKIKDPPNPPGGTKSFDEFWELYPRKIDKQKALKAFAKANLSDGHRTAIMDGIKARAAFWEAQGTEQQYIPHPATWLNGHRWEDSIEPVNGNGSRPKKSWSELQNERFGLNDE